MMRRALVVDDDRSMVKTLSDVLEQNGRQATPAYSVRAGAYRVMPKPVDMPALLGGVLG